MNIIWHIQEQSVIKPSDYGFFFLAVGTDLGAIPDMSSYGFCSTGPNWFLCISICPKSDRRPGGMRGAIESAAPCL